jgi:hypothetical protein
MRACVSACVCALASVVWMRGDGWVPRLVRESLRRNARRGTPRAAPPATAACYCRSRHPSLLPRNVRLACVRAHALSPKSHRRFGLPVCVIRIIDPINAARPAEQPPPASHRCSPPAASPSPWMPKPAAPAAAQCDVRPPKPLTDRHLSFRPVMALRLWWGSPKTTGRGGGGAQERASAFAVDLAFAATVDCRREDVGSFCREPRCTRVARAREYLCACARACCWARARVFLGARARDYLCA